jgi:hypothetical protein
MVLRVYGKYLKFMENNMKTINLKTALSCILFTAILLISGCAFQPAADGKESETAGHTVTFAPYASADELDAVTNIGPDYLYYKILRNCAVVDMQGFIQTYHWQNAVVSDKPIVIYNTEKNPKYYEFRVVRDGQQIGIIATIVNKKDGSPIAYVVNNVLDYSRITGNEALVADNYPYNAAFGRISANGSSFTGFVDYKEEKSITPDEKDNPEIFLKAADISGLKIYGITNQQQLSVLKENILKNQNENIAKWNKLLVEQASILKMTDAELIQKTAAAVSRDMDGSSEYKIPEYDNITGYQSPTYINKYGNLTCQPCGVDCLWWIYAGKYNLYNGKKVLDANQAGAVDMRNDLIKYGIWTDDAGNLMIDPSSMSCALHNSTFGEYNINTWGYLGINYTDDGAWCHSIETHLKNTGNPVLCETVGHYLVVYGTRIAWKTEWWGYYWEDHYVWVHDNGHEAGTGTCQKMNEHYYTAFYPVEREAGIIPVPDYPALVSPANNAVLIAGNNTFTWNPANKAQSYQLKIDGNVVVSSTLDTSASISITAPGSHQWEVVAVNHTGSVSSKQNLTIKMPVNITAPVNNAHFFSNSTCTITWETLPGSSFKTIYIDNIQVYTFFGSGTSCSLPMDISCGSHTLKVTACLADNSIIESQQVSFYVEKMSPVSGTIAQANNQVNFAFDFGNYYEYEIFLDNVSQGDQVTRSKKIAITPGYHTWYVKGNNYGFTYVTATQYIQMALMTPSDNSYVDSTRPAAFNWDFGNYYGYEIFIDGTGQGSQPGKSFSKSLTPGSHTWYVKGYCPGTPFVTPTKTVNVSYLLTPANNDTLTNRAVYFDWALPSYPIAGCQLFIDGTERYVSSIGGVSGSKTYVFTTSGAHTWYVRYFLYGGGYLLTETRNIIIQ